MDWSCYIYVIIVLEIAFQDANADIVDIVAIYY